MSLAIEYRGLEFGVGSLSVTVVNDMYSLGFDERYGMYDMNHDPASEKYSDSAAVALAWCIIVGPSHPNPSRSLRDNTLSRQLGFLSASARMPSGDSG